MNRITDKLGRIAALLAGVRPDALMIGGAACISYGAWLVYAPAGYMVGGALGILAGWLDSRGAA